MKGFFGAFYAIFRAPPVVPELSASFSSAHTCECSRAPGVPESPGVLTGIANACSDVVDKNAIVERRVNNNNNTSSHLKSAPFCESPFVLMDFMMALTP